MRFLVRRKLRQIAQASLWFLGSAVLAVGFQNCGGYEPMYNPLYDNASESECVGVSCTRDAEDIELLVMNEKMMQVDKPASLGFSNCSSSPNYCVDIAGYCDLGGYPESAISYTINGPNGLSVPQTTSTAKCDAMGRFQMQITLPSNYQFDQFLNVDIFLQAVDEQGYTVDNPRGSNVQKLTIWGS